MTALPAAEPPPSRARGGAPRSPADAAALAQHDRRMHVPLVLSAVLPLVLVPQQGNPVAVVVGVGSWLVFLYDFVVHVRRSEHYLGSGFGRLDLVIVVVTAPWFLVPGAGAGSAVVLLRLARLVRLVMATRGARRLVAQLGRVAVVALSVLGVGAVVAYYAEHPVNEAFGSVGDALWWATVTLTTVGYGDIYPVTSTGRWAGVFLMVTGIAVLGVLAGSLASFFRLGAGEPDGSQSSAPAEPPDAVLAELGRLRAQVAELAARLDRH